VIGNHRTKDNLPDAGLSENPELLIFSFVDLSQVPCPTILLASVSISTYWIYGIKSISSNNHLADSDKRHHQ
jgi:hypothetical protein